MMTPSRANPAAGEEVEEGEEEEEAEEEGEEEGQKSQKSVPRILTSSWTVISIRWKRIEK